MDEEEKFQKYAIYLYKERTSNFPMRFLSSYIEIFDLMLAPPPKKRDYYLMLCSECLRWEQGSLTQGWVLHINNTFTLTVFLGGLCACVCVCLCILNLRFLWCCSWEVRIARILWWQTKKLYLRKCSNVLFFLSYNHEILVYVLCAFSGLR